MRSAGRSVYTEGQVCAGESYGGIKRHQDTECAVEDVFEEEVLRWWLTSAPALDASTSLEALRRVCGQGERGIAGTSMAVTT